MTRLSDRPPVYFRDADEHRRQIAQYLGLVGDALTGWAATSFAGGALTAGASIPGYDTTVPGWLFVNAGGEQVQATYQIPRSWDAESPLFAFVRWSKTTAAVGTVDWTLRYKKAPAGAVVDAAWSSVVTSGSSTLWPDNDLAGEHLVSALPAIALSPLRRNDLLLFEIERSASDTYGANARLLGVDFVLRSDGLTQSEILA